MPKQKTEQTIKEELVNVNFRMAAYILYEIVRTIDSVVNYGLDKGDIPEVHLKISKDGLSAIMMDKAKVAMIKLNASASTFEKLDIKAEGELCFNANDILSILKNVKRETYDSDMTVKTEGEMLNFSTDGAKGTFELEHSDYIRTFNLSQIEPERSMSDGTGIPNLEQVSNFALRAQDLKRILHDVAVVEGTYIRFIINEGKVRVESGHDTTPPSKTFGADLLIAPEKGSIALVAAYDLGFLASFVNNLPKNADQMKFSITKIKDNVGPVTVNVDSYNELSLLLAPRYELD